METQNLELLKKLANYPVMCPSREDIYLLSSEEETRYIAKWFIELDKKYMDWNKSHNELKIQIETLLKNSKGEENE